MTEAINAAAERLEAALTEALTDVLQDGGVEQPYGVIAERVAASVADTLAARSTPTAPAGEWVTAISPERMEAACRALHECVSDKDPDEPLHHPAQKSWEEPTQRRWQQWAEVVEAVHSALSVGVEEVAVLDWLATQTNLSLDYEYGEPEDDEGRWEVHRESGGRNDREWELVAFGDTPSAALTKARAILGSRGGSDPA